MGRFYRVPFKSLPRVQIKREIMYHSRRYWRIGSSRSFKRPGSLADLGQKCLGGLGGLEAWKDLEGSEGSGGLVGSEGLRGLEVQKFKVVRKVLVV